MMIPIASFLGDSTVIPSTIVSQAPKKFLAPSLAPQLVALLQKHQGINATILGAATVLPASVASKITWKNVGIGGALAVVGYFAWTRFLAPPPKRSTGTKPSTAPSTAASTISGLFGRRRRRRR